MSCKGCDRLENLASLEIEQLVSEQLELEKDLASLEQRDNRLSICQDCSYRESHTCLKCGCLVLFRTSLEMKKCPLGKW